MRKRVIRFFIISIACAAIFSVTGCASIASGSKQEISIRSKPEDAVVIITDATNGMEIWNSTTPAVVELDRGDGFFRSAEYTVEIQKTGYRKETFMISGRLNGGWYLVGNFFIGGLLGWLIIDPATGAMWTLEPDSVHKTLKRDGSAYNTEDSGEEIMVVLREEIEDEVFMQLPKKRVY